MMTTTDTDSQNDSPNNACCYPQVIKTPTIIGNANSISSSSTPIPSPSSTTTTTVTCRRPVVWNIIGYGCMCHYHFERFILAYDINFSRIRRLSEDDKDFLTHDGKGSGSNQWRRKWNGDVAAG